MKNFALITIFLTVFLDIFGFGIIIPLLPFYAKQFGADEAVIGMLMASNSLAQFIFNPIWGRLSDKYGRRPIILTSVMGSVIAYFLFGFAGSLTMLFVSRILSGIGGATIGVAQSCVSDLTTKENRAKTLGLLGAFFGLGFIFGPLTTGLLSYMGASHSVPGYVASFLSLINFIMVFIFLPESNKKTSKEKKEQKFDWVGFKVLMKEYEMILLFLMQFITMLSMSNLFATCSLFLEQRFGYSEKESAFVFAYFGVCTVVVQGFLVGKLTNRYSEAKLLVLASISMTVGLGLMPFMPEIYSLCLITTLIFFGNSLMNPCLTSLITQKTKSSLTGITLGVSQSLGSFARIFGPIWGGYIFKVAGYQYPYITGSLLGVVVIILSLKFVTEKNDSENIENMKVEPVVNN